MDRLNPKEDNFDDLSISQEDFDDDEEMIGDEDAEVFDQEGEEALQHDRAAEGGGAEEAGWHRGSQDSQAPYRCTTSKVFLCKVASG